MAAKAAYVALPADDDKANGCCKDDRFDRELER